MVGALAAVLADAASELRVDQNQRVAQQALALQVVVERLEPAVECVHQVHVGAGIRSLLGVRVVAAGLHPEHLGADLFVHSTGYRPQRLRETVVRVGHRGLVGRHRGNAIERAHRRLRCRIHEREVRPIDRQVRRNAELCRSLVHRLGAAVGARERICRRARDRGHADLVGDERPRCFAVRVPGHQRIGIRDGVEIASEPASARRVLRAARAPDVEAREV